MKNLKLIFKDENLAGFHEITKLIFINQLNLFRIKKPLSANPDLQADSFPKTDRHLFCFKLRIFVTLRF